MLRATLLIIIIFSTLITLHPPRICRLAVFSIKPTLLSLPFAVIWAGSGHEYHSFHASHLLRSAQTRRLGLSPFPCPPCLFLCLGGVGFRLLAHGAQLGRLGGSRSG